MRSFPRSDTVQPEAGTDPVRRSVQRADLLEGSNRVDDPFPSACRQAGDAASLLLDPDGGTSDPGGNDIWGQGAGGAVKHRAARQLRKPSSKLLPRAHQVRARTQTQGVDGAEPPDPNAAFAGPRQTFVDVVQDGGHAASGAVVQRCAARVRTGTATTVVGGGEGTVTATACSFTRRATARGRSVASHTTTEYTVHSGARPSSRPRCRKNPPPRPARR